MSRQMTLIGALVAVFSGAAILVAVVALNKGLNADSSPLIVTVLGFASLIILQLLNLLKAEEGVQKVDKVQNSVNGGGNGAGSGGQSGGG